MLSSNKWTTVSGVCRPMDTPTLELWKTLQREVNRVRALEKKPLIGVDGRIGSQTTSAVKEIVASKMPIVQLLSLKSCGDVAKHSPELLAGLRALANASNAPVVPDPPSSKPSIPSPRGGGVPIHPEISPIDSVVDFLTGPVGMLAAAAGIGYFAFFAKKRKGRR